MQITSNNSNYKNINACKSPSFGLKIIKDNEFYALENYCGRKYGQDYFAKAVERIESIGRIGRPTDEFSIMFYPIKNRIDKNDFEIDQGLFFDKKIYGVPRRCVQYDFFNSNGRAPRRGEYQAWLESRWLSLGFGGARYKTDLDPMRLVLEIQKDFFDWLFERMKF